MFSPDIAAGTDIEGLFIKAISLIKFEFRAED
jgi:hypothetical protein